MYIYIYTRTHTRTHTHTHTHTDTHTYIHTYNWAHGGGQRVTGGSLPGRSFFFVRVQRELLRDAGVANVLLIYC